MLKSAEDSGPSPLFGSLWLGERREKEEEKDREGRGEWGFLHSLPLCQPLDVSHSAPAPQKPPVRISSGGWTEEEQSPPPGSPPGGEPRRRGRKLAGGSKGGREAGRREEERGRREGGTEERRLNKETRSWGWQGVQGRGGQTKGSGGT
jgi:hypothetical protein